MESAKHFPHQQRHLSSIIVRFILCFRAFFNVFYLQQQRQIPVGGAIFPYLIDRLLFSLTFFQSLSDSLLKVLTLLRGQEMIHVVRS